MVVHAAVPEVPVDIGNAEVPLHVPQPTLPFLVNLHPSSGNAVVAPVEAAVPTVPTGDFSLPGTLLPILNHTGHILLVHNITNHNGNHNVTSVTVASPDPNAVVVVDAANPTHSHVEFVVPTDSSPGQPMLPAFPTLFTGRQSRLLEDDAVVTQRPTIATKSTKHTVRWTPPVKKVTSSTTTMTKRTTTAAPATWPAYPTDPITQVGSSVTPPSTVTNVTAMLPLENATVTDVTTVENATTFNFPLLPDQRNVDQTGGGSGDGDGEKGGSTHEGLTPFTIPDTKLAQFLFSTLLPAVTEQVTVLPTPNHPEITTWAPTLTTTVKPHRKTHMTHRYMTTASPATEGGQWAVADLITVPGQVSRDVIATTITPVTPTTTTGLSVTEESMETTVTTVRVLDGGGSGMGNTTFPRPLLFWSDKPPGGGESGGGSSAETTAGTVRKLFDDDTDGGLQWTGNEQQVSERAPCICVCGTLSNFQMCVI